MASLAFVEPALSTTIIARRSRNVTGRGSFATRIVLAAPADSHLSKHRRGMVQLLHYLHRLIPIMPCKTAGLTYAKTNIGVCITAGSRLHEKPTLCYIQCILASTVLPSSNSISDI